MEISRYDYYKSILILCLAVKDDKGTPVDTNIDFSLKDSDLLSSYVDSLTDVFCQYGLEENGEPNACGLILEDAIDFFNNLIYKTM